MNEIELTTKIEGLKKAITEHKDFAGNYEDELKRAEQQLKDYNKPELTPMQLDDIYLAVEQAVGEFDFSDTDNFDIEYGIEYDGKVHCETHEINNTTDLVESICDKVTRLFKEVEEEPTAEQINKTTTDNS